MLKIVKAKQNKKQGRKFKMKKRIKQVGIYVAGFITATVILLGVNSAWASQILQAIYVDFNPIRIIIDGHERTPSADMAPFIYNGRVYVALRYVGEAFGKQVDWNGQTRTVAITDPKPRLTQYSESFTNTNRLSDWWIKTEGDSWLIDGPNGLRLNSTGYVALTDFFPNTIADFTVEYEATRITHERPFPSIFLGIDPDGNYKDVFQFGSRNQMYYSEHLASLFSRGVGGESAYLGNYTAIESGEYASFKIQVKDRHVSIFMNGILMAQRGLTNRAAFGFAIAHSDSIYGDRYVRNFKITID
jgi:hypothetical protein